MALISCRDVTMTYENTVALRDLTFTVESGDYLCVLGENGIREKYAHQRASGSESACAWDHCVWRRPAPE